MVQLRLGVFPGVYELKNWPEVNQKVRVRLRLG